MKNIIHSVLILIAVLRSTTGAEEVIYAQVGEKVILQAPALIPQNHYVYWFFGGKDGLQLAWLNHFGGNGIAKETLWKDKLSWFGRSLSISQVQPEHFGTFVCKVTDGVATSLTSYKLVRLSVRMNSAPPLLPGERLILTCNVEGPKKQKTHLLNPQGKKVSDEGRFTKSATSQDNGQWTCVVTNGEKTHKTPISVSVVDLSPSLSRQYTSTYSPLTLPCSLPPHISWENIRNKSIKEVQWHFSPKPSSSLISGDRQRLFFLSLEGALAWKADQNRGLLTAPDLTKGNLSLTRPRGKEDDRGSYTCSMSFKNGVTLSSTVHVEVLQITSTPGTEVISGQQVNLSCSTGGPLPSDLQPRWFPPEKSSLRKSDHRFAHVTIRGVGMGDGGRWRCELWRNNTRLVSAVITLKIEPKLSVWMLVIICSAAVIIILLFILALILYRRRQRKMRHLRHRLCQCKNPKPKGFYRT